MEAFTRHYRQAPVDQPARADIGFAVRIIVPDGRIVDFDYVQHILAIAKAAPWRTSASPAPGRYTAVLLAALGPFVLGH